MSWPTTDLCATVWSYVFPFFWQADSLSTSQMVWVCPIYRSTYTFFLLWRALSLVQTVVFFFSSILIYTIDWPACSAINLVAFLHLPTYNKHPQHANYIHTVTSSTKFYPLHLLPLGDTLPEGSCLFITTNSTLGTMTVATAMSPIKGSSWWWFTRIAAHFRHREAALTVWLTLTKYTTALTITVTRHIGGKDELLWGNLTDMKTITIDTTITAAVRAVPMTVAARTSNGALSSQGRDEWSFT